MACRLGDESFLGFELVRKIVIGESSCCCNYNFCQVNGDAELDVHVFIGQPSLPGLPCPGEDRNVYRRGARRWKKFYLYNGHRFQAKRLNRRIHCFICHDYIWGLGRQGYRCVDCRLCVHKKCHRLVREHCEQKPLAEQPHRPPPAPLPSALRGGSGERRSTVGVDNGAFQDFV